MLSTIFREYDIRGIFEKELNEKTVKLIGYFLGKRVREIGEYVAIGYDARTHSPLLFGYLASGFNKAGVKVLNMGMVPTPVNYFSNYCDFDGIVPNASVMITGSHNPPEYNGFKITIDKKPFFSDDIYALGREVLANKDMHIEDNEEHITIDVKSRYISYMLRSFSHLKGLNAKIAADCGNGVAGIVLEDIFKGLNLDYKGLFCEPDGTFPNHHPDPSEEKNLKSVKEALKTADIGFAYDGDADRIAVLTKKHNFKGDQLAILFARQMKNPVVVGEVKCSQVMYDEINKIGRAVMWKTGHSNLKVKMKEIDADLAAEVSGHIFFADRYYGFDDAIYATLRVLELIKNGMDLDKEIEKLPKVYNTEEIKIKTDEDKKFKIIARLKEFLKNPPADFPKIKDIIDVDGVRVIFENGWGLVRASNTTPVLVMRFEAQSPEDARLYQEKLTELVEKAREEM
ncbi:phosphomannomutase/phosphoglucomutase [Nitrosophilus alvini]|uniref:phosphomannomutase/phosphoglucomutase n=1 Tax=Nitrosophilus alvini TaxID=2714855 RepID=UPI001909EAD0|nr:phosphomannomutase/phosphoglucomutase [Nitrosophilus alvini]